MLRVLTLSALLAAAACVPQPGGQCASDGDCRAGTTCLSGLCRPEQQCVHACETGFSCQQGLCSPAVAPTLTWVAPEDGTIRAAGKLQLRVAASGPFAPASMKVVARAAGSPTAAAVTIALRPDGPGLWSAELDSGLLRDAAWALTPFASVGDVELPGPARALRVDRTGPAIEIALPRPAGAAAAFRRDETVTIRARITDAGSGVDPATVALLVEGLEPLHLDRESDDQFKVVLPLSRPALLGLSGELALRVVARDRLGNAASGEARVPVTRVLWRADLGTGLPLRGSAALDATHVFIGTDAGRVLAVDRRTGVTVWSRELAGPVSAPPARGDELVFAASEGGDVVALEAATGAVRWRCPDLSGALRFVSAPAVARFEGLATGASPEGVYLVNAGQLPARLGGSFGGLVAVEGSLGFPSPDGQRSCYRLAAIGGGPTSPSVDLDGSVYVGTRGGADGSRARRLRFGPGASGWSFTELWSAALADDPAGAPALAGDGTAIFGDASGTLSRFSSSGSSLWTPPAALGEKLVAAPVVAFTTLLAQGRAGTLAPFELGALPGSASDGSAPSYVAEQLPSAGDVAATPAIGADGTVYVAAGRSLRALSPRGALLWEAPLEGGATSSSPVLGCDGGLYVGDGKGGLLSISTDSRGLAPGWPRLGHDARGSGNAASALCE